jgi:hypothetical protein
MSEIDVTGDTIQTTSVIVPMRSLTEVKRQRQELLAYIQSELKRDVDYGLIPGVKKDSLFKPGAEKLLNLFGLGSRIIDKWREIDAESGFVVVGYTVEVFHLQSGKSIAQCEGSCNSKEKKYASRPGLDQMNTLMKMAQKRALVGATILATHASDYFTQDVEDMDPESFSAQSTKQTPPPVSAAQRSQAPLDTTGVPCAACNKPMAFSQKARAFYCSNFKTPLEGRKHSYVLEKDWEAFQQGDDRFL